MNINTTNKEIDEKNVTPNIKVKNFYSRFFSKEFWDDVFTKLVATMISVKVWGLITVTIISTWLLINGYIDGGNWTTVMTGVFGIIYGMREIFKISKIKELIDEDKIENVKKIKI